VRGEVQPQKVGKKGVWGVSGGDREKGEKRGGGRVAQKGLNLQGGGKKKPQHSCPTVGDVSTRSQEREKKKSRGRRGKLKNSFLRTAETA